MEENTNFSILPDDNETVEDGGGCFVAGARSNDPIHGFVQYARKLRNENEQLKEELPQLLSEIASIFKGWHSDGTAWSEYDQSVFEKLIAFQVRLEKLFIKTDLTDCA